MGYDHISAAVFTVAEDPNGGFAVYVAPDAQHAAALPQRVGFSLVANDRHSAETMAAMFNRVVVNVIPDPKLGKG